MRRHYIDVLRGRIFYRCVDWNLELMLTREIDIRSHLLQMRGLKPPNIRSLYQWPLSHLLQMRGLKLPADADQIKSDCRIFYRCVDWNLKDRNLPLPSASSHLLQMRGLKPLLLIWWAIRLVASFTDAWIETDKILGQIHFNWSHLLQMRGLKLFYL